MADETAMLSMPSSIDGDNAARTTGARRPSLPLRRSTSGLSHRASSNPNLRQTHSRHERLSRASTDILLPRIAESPFDDSGEPAQWHSASLLFVALPAFAGIFFENGSSIMTDVLMLGLGCLFLYWSVKWPWQWYLAAQAITLAEENSDDYAVYDDSSDEEKEELPAVQEDAEASQQASVNEQDQVKRDKAVKSLESDERMALFMCFVSPMAVAYLLHAIRPYLSRPSGGIVSNSNLTLFVLAAEVRPLLHLSRLVEARTLRLQRMVTSLPNLGNDNTREQIDALAQRIEEIAARPASVSPLATDKDRKEQSDPSIEKNVRQSLQPQLDALNRAVRGYEKRARTQAMVTEARLQDLEGRLRDALSLAAAASRSHRPKPGVLLLLLHRISSLLMAPIEALAGLLFWPFRLLAEFYRFLFGPRRKKKSTKSPPGLKGKSRLEQR